MIKIPQSLDIMSKKIISQQITISITRPPLALLKLPSGAIFNSLVISSSKNGVMRLDSVFGQLTAKTAHTLPSNSSLELQLVSSQPQLHLLLKKINGINVKYPVTISTINKALNSGLRPHFGLQNKLNNTINPKSNSSKLDIGAKIHATLLRPIKNPINPPTQNNNSAGKIPLEEKSMSQSTPDVNAQKNKKGNFKSQNNLLSRTISWTHQGFETIKDKTTSIARSSILQAIQFLNENNKDNKSLSSASLLPGTNLVLNFIGTAKNTDMSSRNTVKSQNIINAIVVAKTPTGQPILKTDLGMLAVEGGVSLEIGLKIRMELLPQQATLPNANSSLVRLEHIFHSNAWSNLAEAIHEIELMVPRASGDLISAKLPQANTLLTSNLLFYLNALKGGDLRSWIGNNATNILAQNRPQLLTQLIEDFSLMSQANSESQSNDWRTAIIPFLTDTGLEKFYFHTQTGKNKEKTDGDNNNARFIIDVSLSRLGRLQLDGFLSKKRKQLDLIVRAQKSLPKQMRLGISQIYSDFSKLSKITGNISFQANQRFIEIPMPRLTAYSKTGTLI